MGHRIDGVLDRVLRKVPDRIERAVGSAVAAPSHRVRRRTVGGVARPDEQLHEAYAVTEPVVEASEHRSPALVPGRPGDQLHVPCLLYTSDAADERSSVALGGRRILKKKKTTNTIPNTPLNHTPRPRAYTQTRNR